MGGKRRTPATTTAAPEVPEVPPLSISAELDKAAIKRLAARIDKYVNAEKINNAQLYAGASMYYYCKMCEGLAARLPESHWGEVPEHCTECKELLEVTGLTPTTLVELAQDYREEAA